MTFKISLSPPWYDEYTKIRHYALRTHWLHTKTITVTNMLHIIQHENELESLIIPLSNDFHRNLGIHFCTMEHRQIQCCGFATTMHNGTTPGITMIYIDRNCLKGAKIIAKDLRKHFPSGKPNNPTLADMFRCPGCNVKFSEQ